MADTDSRAWASPAAVLGLGTMGLGIAEALCLGGLEVRVVDDSPERTRQGHEALGRRVRTHADAGLVEADAADRLAAVRAADGVADAVAGAGLVVEAVFETLDVKREVLTVCGDRAPADAVIASNTSSLPIDDLSRFVDRPGRFLGMHWFNPPEWTPGVEVIPAGGTDREVVERTVAVLRAIGKRPTVVGDGPGFVANRLQNALFAEAVACVDDGLATPAQVDEVVRTTFGFRLPFFGPFQIADMAGLDVYREVFRTLERGLGERFRPPAALERLVEADRRGTKNGAGFFDYTTDERERLLAERDRRYAALSGLLREHPPVTAGSEPGRDDAPDGEGDR
ncbi:3-hydroxyacyl-CoA dehydrogenase family protein [soil metagenome]